MIELDSLGIFPLHMAADETWSNDTDSFSPRDRMVTERTLVIVPTYNERENAPRIVQAILSLISDVDVLLVDDASPDGTADYAEEAFASERRFSVMRRHGSRGLGLSYVDAYRYALAHGYDRVVQMDADFSHDPKSIPDLITLSAEHDVVIGSRYCEGGRVRNWPLHRRFLSRFANAYVSLITGVPVHDTTSGFRCYARPAIETITRHAIWSEGYAFQVECTYKVSQAGLSIAETPITFVDRLAGKSKMSKAVILESIFIPWRLRFNTPAVSNSK